MTFSRAFRLVALVLPLSTLGACERSPSSRGTAQTDLAPSGAPVETQAAPQAEAASGTASGAASPASGRLPADTVGAQRITTGEATVEVTRVDRARAALLDATRRAGGYVGGEEAWDADEARSARLTLRLPVRRVATVDSVLAGLGRVTRRTTQVEDVTAAYVDLAARVRTRRAVEARYVDLLARAGSIEDILAVEARLAAVREEIEAADGQIRLWDRQVAYATLAVTLVEPTSGRSAPFGRVGDALADGWALLAGLALGLLRLWPLALLVPVALWGGRRWKGRRSASGLRSAREGA